MDMMNQKDKGKMLSIIIGDSGYAEEHNDGLEAAKEIGKALGIELDDAKAADLYRALDLAYHACSKDEEVGESSEENSDEPSTY